VKSIEDKEWECEIIDQKCGVSGAKWMPDSVHLMLISDF